MFRWAEFSTHAGGHLPTSHPVTDDLRREAYRTVRTSTFFAASCSHSVGQAKVLWQAMERALFEAQHGAARIAAEAAGPLYLHARPPPPPLVRPARVSYAALLSRFRQDAAADRMSSFHDDPADSDSAPSGSAELSGLASHAAQRGRRKHAECRVCRSVEHDTQRCPVVWLAGYAGTEADAGPMHAAHGSAEQHQPEECPWLVRLPESIKNNMDAMQQYAADIANEHAFGYNSRLVCTGQVPCAALPLLNLTYSRLQRDAVM